MKEYVEEYEETGEDLGCVTPEPPKELMAVVIII